MEKINENILIALAIVLVVVNLFLKSWILTAAIFAIGIYTIIKIRKNKK